MASAETEYKRRRRKIWAGGGTAAALLFVGGGYFYDTRVEDDLETRVPTALADAGYPGVSAKFSGQDGTLACGQPIDDPAAAEEVAVGVYGVNKITLEDSCRTNTGATTDTTPAPTTETTEAASVDYNTVGEALSGNPEYTLFSDRVSEADVMANLNDAGAGPYTVFAPSSDAMGALPDAQLAVLDSQPDLQNEVLGYHVVEGVVDPSKLADGAELTTVTGQTLVVSGSGADAKIGGASITDGPITTNNGTVYTIDSVLIPDGVDLAPTQTASATAAFDGTAVVLEGMVATEAERATLVDAATAAVGADNVTDNLAVDETAGIDAATAGNVGQLIDGMTTNLVQGEAGFKDGALFVTGTYATEDDKAAMMGIADGVKATADLTQRPEATEANAADLQALLNAYVADNPILFEPGSSQLTPESDEVIERLATDLNKVGNLKVVVEGHTDSDGDAATNKALSESRAAVVAEQLVERGVPAENVSSVGFGEEQPVLADGAEDKAASRRVVFKLEPAS